MSTVIAFQKLNKKSPGFYGPAQIVIFPGVRHERLTDSEIAKSNTNRRLVMRANQAVAEEFEYLS
jgi:hypothetical protein